MFKVLFALVLLLSAGAMVVAIQVASNQVGANAGTTLITTKGTTSTTSVTSSVTTSIAKGSAAGTLAAEIQIGPIYPVCVVGAANNGVPDGISSIQAVITSLSNNMTMLPVSWTSDGCNVSGSLGANFAPGTYQLSLSSCTFMGCQHALPKDFTILPGQTTQVEVSITTGIA